MGRYNVHARVHRLEIQVRKGEKNLCSLVSLLARWAPFDIVESALVPAVFLFEVVSYGIEGSQNNTFSWRRSRRSRYPVYAEYFCCLLPSDIRNNTIFGLVLFHAYRFCNPFKQIHRRCRIDAKGIFIDDEIGFGGPVQVYPNIKGVGKSQLSEPVQAMEIKKEKLLRETEVFEKEEVAWKRSSGIGDHPLIHVEPHRLNVFRCQ